MIVCISGSTGFLGSALSSFLKDKGYTVLPLTRDMLYSDNKSLSNAISSCEAVINLAGATINKRWSKRYKEEIIDSRTITTRKIVDTINSLDHKPNIFISASAVGRYPVNKTSKEESPTEDNTFLSKVCKLWEEEALKCKSNRVVISRFAVVFSPHEGALKKIMLPFSFNTAVIFSTGCSPFPWISLTDWLNAMYHILSNDHISGVINIVSPQTISYNQIVESIKKCKPAFITITIPSFIKKFLFGEMGEVITGGQHVIPQKLIDDKFQFEHPTLETYLKGSLSPH